MSPSPSYDSMLVACADGRLLAVVLPSDLLLSDRDGWAGELELADVHQGHTGPILQVAAETINHKPQTTNHYQQPQT